jgi:hypothetical protein
MQHSMIERIVKSTYYDYGRPNETPEASTEWLDEAIHNREKSRYFFFVRQEAWDWAVKRFRVSLESVDDFKWIRKLDADMNAILADTVKAGGKAAESAAKILAKRKPPEDLPQPWQAEVAAVLHAFMATCRTPLGGYWATGQWHANEQLNPVESLAKLTLRVVWKKKRENRQEAERDRRKLGKKKKL